MKLRAVIHATGAAKLVETITAFSRRVRLRQIAFTGRCPHCGESSKITQFRRHDYRRRQFRVIQGRLIYKITGTVPRWRCSQCTRTFTDYPSFAIPYRQYTQPQVLAILTPIQDGQCSTRSLARIDDMPIFHLNSNDTILAHTTCWRWVSSPA